MSKKPCFLRLFWIFFKLGAILAHQTSYCMFSGSWGIFWHPWDPWGRINSGDTRVLRFVFDFFACQRPLADFFHSSQIEARCHFYWFDMNKSDSLNGWIFKVIQAVSVGIRANNSSVIWGHLFRTNQFNQDTKLFFGPPETSLQSKNVLCLFVLICARNSVVMLVNSCLPWPFRVFFFCRFRTDKCAQNTKLFFGPPKTSSYSQKIYCACLCSFVPEIVWSC